MLLLNLPVLLFVVITLVKLRQSVEAALLDVLLPTLLLVPAIYYLRIPHIPLMSCYDAVLIPLGVAVLVFRAHHWRFQRADLWVIGFALAGFYTDYLNLGLVTALYNFLEPGLLNGVLAYFVGKMAIEHSGIREKFVDRMAVLLAVVGFLSISEFALKRNLFVILTHRFFGQVDYWGDQFRSGFMRVKGPFMGPEEAGIVFLVGSFLSIWLWYLHRSRTDVPEPKYFGMRRSTLCMAGILLGLMMTLSRGPILGVFAGYLIARIGLVKRRRLAVVLALLLILTGGVIAHRRAVTYSKAYSAQEISLNEAEASATYRTRLYDVYKPIAEKGGLFGWSATAYPRAPSFFSIDNEYLLLWVTQGKVGLFFFVVIAAESAIAIIRAVLCSQQAADISFYCCLGGMLCGLTVVLSTVFLAGQGYILFFLVSGWIQSLPDDGWAPRFAPQFAFRRVFT